MTDSEVWIMDRKTEEEYIDFMQTQLSEMAKTVRKKSQANTKKRENNVFLIFQDKMAAKYMGVGRSLDSQLGTRLQKIAMFAARRKYGKDSVPNVVTLHDEGETIKVSMISYPYKYGMSQKVYYTKQPIKELLSKDAKALFESGKITSRDFSVTSDKKTIAAVKTEIKKHDLNDNGIPIDLFIWKTTADGKHKAYSYEIKAGGNLDTKNAPSNANEVKRLEKMFSFCDKSKARFATCYDGKGDGTPDGSIGHNLDRKQILIGKEFWKEILEPGVSYDDFIKMYKQAYQRARVEEIIVG